MAAPSSSQTTAQAPGAEIVLDASTLGQIATGIAAAASVWQPFVSHDPAQRTRVRLLATAAYEIWLLGWAPGHAVGLHDHGDANGAFVVVEGVLTERTLVGGHVIEETVGVGGVGRIPIGAVHDVVNRSRRNATSIHAYSRPLAEMGFYDAAGSLLRVEAIAPESAAVTIDDLSLALHPASRGRL